MTISTPTPLFDSRIRRAKRNRAAAIERISEHFLVRAITEELAERLSWVTRDFRNIALIGPMADLADALRLSQEVDVARLVLSEAERSGQSDLVMGEDRLIEALADGGDINTARGRFDLVIGAPLFDSIDDLPGALAQIRIALKPDGLFLGAMFAGGSLALLRRLMQAADDGRGVARLHPQVDLRALGDLMSRAGFAMPVVDEQAFDISYADPAKALCDLRALGHGNALADQHPLPGKGAMIRLLQQWEAMGDERGRVKEHIVIAHMSGWAPSPDQPKPARPGSARASLADALRDRSSDQAE